MILNEGAFIVNDYQGKIKSINVKGEYRTGDCEGYTITKFVAHKGGVTPIRCQDLNLNSYMGEYLVVDVTAYDADNNGDLVLFSYRGLRKGKFDGGPENPEAQVTIYRLAFIHSLIGELKEFSDSPFVATAAFFGVRYRKESLESSAVTSTTKLPPLLR